MQDIAQNLTQQYITLTALIDRKPTYQFYFQLHRTATLHDLLQQLQKHYYDDIRTKQLFLDQQCTKTVNPHETVRKGALFYIAFTFQEYEEQIKKIFTGEGGQQAANQAQERNLQQLPEEKSSIKQPQKTEGAAEMNIHSGAVFEVELASRYSSDQNLLLPINQTPSGLNTVNQRTNGPRIRNQHVRQQIVFEEQPQQFHPLEEHRPNYMSSVAANPYVQSHIQTVGQQSLPLSPEPQSHYPQSQAYGLSQVQPAQIQQNQFEPLGVHQVGPLPLAQTSQASFGVENTNRPAVPASNNCCTLI